MKKTFHLYFFGTLSSEFLFQYFLWSLNPSVQIMIFSITADTGIKDSLLFACFLTSLRTFHRSFHRWTPATHTHPHFYHPSIGPSEHCKMSAQENWDLESSDSETESEAMEQRDGERRKMKDARIKNLENASGRWWRSVTSVSSWGRKNFRTT